MVTSRKRLAGQDKKRAHQYPGARPMGRERTALAEEPQAIRLQRAIADPARARPAEILALQRRAGNRAVSRLIQAKLAVGPVNDHYEQEADRVAEQVMAQGSRGATGQGRPEQAQLEESAVRTGGI